MSDLFISYSRKDRDFVKQLFEALERDNRDVWVDWENIPLTADWLEEIYSGIEAAHTFVFIISPDSVRSEVCSLEVMHAIEHNKRMVPIMRRELVDKAEQAALHPTISSHNWIFFTESDDFASSYKTFTTALDTDLEHLQMHTRLLVRAVEWNDKDRDASFLLRGSDLVEAERWLSAGRDKQPIPTDLQTEFIASSRRSANARRRVIILTAVYVIIVAALAIFALYQAVNAEQQRRIALDNESTAVAARGTSEYNERLAVQNEERAESLALASNAQQALFRDNNPPLAIALGLVANQIDDPSPLASSVLAQAAFAPGVRYVLHGFADHGSRVAISPDGVYGVTAAADNQLALLDVYTGVEIHRWETDARIWSVAFTPDGLTVMAGLGDGTIIQFNLETFEEVGRIAVVIADNTDDWNFAITPDSRYVLASSGTDMYLWNIATGEQVQSFTGEHTALIWTVALNGDGTQALTGSEDGFMILWDIDTGEAINRYSPDPSPDAAYNAVWDVAFSPDGTTAVAGYEDNSVRLWNLETNEVIFRFAGHTNRVWNVGVSSNGRVAYSSSYDTTIRLWDLQTGEEIRTFRGHTSTVFGADMSADGHHIFTGSADGTVRYWDIESGAELAIYEGHTHWVWNVVPVPNDDPDAPQQIISSSRDGTVILWDVDNQTPVHVFEGGVGQLRTVAVSSDGQYVASGGDDGTILIWSLDTYELAYRLPPQDRIVYSVAFSPDGRTLLAGYEGAANEPNPVVLWDVESERVIRQFGGTSVTEGHAIRVWNVAFSPDGHLMVSTDASGQIILWDVETGSEIDRFEGHSGVVYSAVFSPDGQFIVSASEDKTVRLWDVTTREQIRRFDGHTLDVNSAVFSPDGSTILSASEDETVRLWDVESGAEILLFEGHTDEILWASYGLDGRTVISAAKDGTVRRWQIISLDELIGWIYANRYVPELTCEQRELYRVEPMCNSDGFFPTRTPYQTEVPAEVTEVTPTANLDMTTATPTPTITPSLTPLPPTSTPAPTMTEEATVEPTSEVGGD